MKSRAAVLWSLVACAVLGVEATGTAGKSTVLEDMARLQGKWLLVSAEHDGLRLPGDMVDLWRGTAKSNEVRVTVAGELFLQAIFFVNPSREIKTIDYEVTAGPLAGQRQLGIYKLSADRVVFCFAVPGRPRPTEFATDTDSGRSLSTWVKAGE